MANVLNFEKARSNMVEQQVRPWEVVDPLIYTQRLSRRHLDDHPARHVYEPVGRGDSYFSPPVYDAMALGYGHQQAGSEVWPEMQKALALTGRDGIVAYPVQDNLSAEADASAKYTGVVVQYEGKANSDPHNIAFDLDTVKYQYSCFLSTFFDTGVGVVFAPKALGTPCQ